MCVYSKKPIGSFTSYVKTKSKLLKTGLIVLSSLILFSVVPYFTGSGLSSAKPMDQYLNGAFPTSLFQENDLYRLAFPNLTFNVPIVLEPVPNQNKIVVAELFGEINWFDNDETTTVKNSIIDLTDQVGVVWDGGLLGMTFHPRFDDPVNPANYMYVYYSSKDRNGGRQPENYSTQNCTNNDEFGGFLVLERYTLDPQTLVADVNSRTKLIVMKLFGYAHRGGGLTFGDDGFLYLTVGDQSAWSKAQEITNGLDGGLLRLDVDMQGGSISHPPIRKLQDHLLPGINYTSSWYANNAGPHPSDGSGGFYTSVFSGENYYIPNDNPFLSPTGSNYEEYYAIGLRSPHRLTKDKVTGDLYIGDVGLYSYDEVNVVMSGKNYGWPVYEGNINGGGSAGCSSMYNNMPHQGPLTAFSTSTVNSIIGGYVYRGSDIPEYYGKYICADYGAGDEIIMVDTNTGDYEILGNFGPQNIVSLGQDYDGELYMLNQDFGTNLYRLTAGGAQFNLMPQTLSATGAFEVSVNNLFEGQFADLTPSQGVIPYELIESFWSDGAYKKRWLVVPNGGDGSHDGASEKITYSEDGDWDFPIGTVLIKHFDLNTDKTNPNQRKKIETRFSIKGADGNFYFLSYKWNATETDAFLQEVGLDEDIEITTETGQTEYQTWTYPEYSQCISCHNQANNGSLGLKSRYINSDLLYDDDGTPTLANQLVTLSSIGVLNTQITDAQTPNILTHKAISDQTATLDERARSYLDLNCAYCHRPDNIDNRGEFDLRLFNSIQETGLLTANILTPLNIDPNEEIIFQGDASKSILFHRLNSIDPNIMMPPLAKSIVDTEATDLIEDWINQLYVCDVRGINIGNQSSCDPVTSTYTQDVIITYVNPPLSGNLIVNGQSFPITLSPQTITLTGLNADGLSNDVTAYFSDSPDCTLTINSAFTAPESCGLTGLPNNSPDDMINLGLISEADITGSVTNGRGTVLDILYDPVADDYYQQAAWNEYGVSGGQNLGIPDADNGFSWQVSWTNPKYINYITFGGSYPNQRQEFTMWRVSYFKDGGWITLDEGQGGWIDNETGNDYDTSSSIYQWGGPDQQPIIAEALRLQLFSDGIHNLVSIHLRGRGGVSQNINDSAASPKATLVQYLPSNTLSVNDEQLENLKVFTNPSNETLNIIGQLDYETNFTLFNLQGRIVKSDVLKPNFQTYSLDVSGLSDGIYILKLKSANGKYRNRKVIIY